MSISFLVALFLAFGLEPPGLGNPPRVGIRIVALFLGLLAVVAFARWISVWAVGGLQGEVGRRSKVLRRYYRATLVHSVLSLIVFGFGVYVVGWPIIVRDVWGLRRIWLVDDFLLIGPFLLGELLSLICFYAVEQSIRQGAVELGGADRQRWPFREYLGFQFRGRYGIWLCSSLLLSGMRDLAEWWVPDWTERAGLAAGMSLGMALTVLLVSPMILRIVWLAKPLGPGPLRTELDELSRRLRFRASNVLVWNTGNGVANAAISGLVPQLRYVLLSDALLEDLTPDEIGAVFGHEVGHIRHRHLPLYFSFIVLSALATGAVGHVGQLSLRSALPESTWNWAEPILEIVPLELMLMAPIGFLGFGHLSRRCERQADLYGARAASQTLQLRPTPISAFDAMTAAYQNGHTSTNGFASSNGATGKGTVLDSLATPLTPTPVHSDPKSKRDPQVTSEGAWLFIQSLEKVALLNGMGRSAWSWRHGSIAQRIEFLERVAEDPTLADRYDRGLRRIIWIWCISMLLTMGLAIGAGVHWFPGSFDLS